MSSMCETAYAVPPARLAGVVRVVDEAGRLHMDIRLGDGMWDDRLPSPIGILFGHDATLEAFRHRSEAPHPRLAPEPAEAS